MKKELTPAQKSFREKIFDELKPELQWANEYINIRVSFDGNKFHLHIIEDYCAHLHVRGELYDDDGIFTIEKVTNHASDDVLYTTMDFLREEL